MRPVRDRINRWHWLLTIAVMVVVTVGAGCSSGRSSGGGTPASGGTLRIGDATLASAGPAVLLTPLRNPAFYPDFVNVADVTAPDPGTVVITLCQPQATLLSVVSVGMLPQHLRGPEIAGGQNPQKTAFAQHPVGTGPFSFASYTVGQSLIVKANDRYWAGRPRLDQVILVPGTAEALLGRLKAGELDMTDVPGTLASSVRGDNRVRVVSNIAQWART